MARAARCIVCGKNPQQVFRVCSECARTHDTTTGDRLAKGQKVYGPSPLEGAMVAIAQDKKAREFVRSVDILTRRTETR